MFSFLSKLGNAKSMLNEFYNSSDNIIELKDDRLREFQLYLLSMYRDIADACEKLGIQCFAVGGTCLGAVRHKGFIPWDDDIDISMTRDEYNVFRKHFNELLGDKYILNAPNNCSKPIARFPKVLAKNTVFVPAGEEETESSKVFLDIFVLDRIPGNPIHRNIKGIYINAMEFISGQVSLYKNQNKMTHDSYKAGGKAQYYIREIIGFLFSYRSYENWCNKIDQAVQYQGDSQNLYGLPTGRLHYLKDLHGEDEIYPLNELPFEGIMIKVPGKTDTYLKNLFHEYMQLPPPEKREHHYLTKLEF